MKDYDLTYTVDSNCETCWALRSPENEILRGISLVKLLEVSWGLADGFFDVSSLGNWTKDWICTAKAVWRVTVVGVGQKCKVILVLSIETENQLVVFINTEFKHLSLGTEEIFFSVVK